MPEASGSSRVAATAKIRSKNNYLELPAQRFRVTALRASLRAAALVSCQSAQDPDAVVSAVRALTPCWRALAKAPFGVVPRRRGGRTRSWTRLSDH